MGQLHQNGGGHHATSHFQLRLELRRKKVQTEKHIITSHLNTVALSFRRFKLYKIDRVCGKATQGQDQSAKALRKYFSKLQLHKVMGFQLDASPLDKKKAKKFIANIEWLDENRFEAVVNFFSSQLIEFR